MNVVEELARRICQLQCEHPLRVAIDGVDAAGKTTLAKELALPIEKAGRKVIRASVDGFHRPAADRKLRGDASAEGYYRDSFDYDQLKECLLAPLGPNGCRRYRAEVFDFRTNRVVDSPTQIAQQDSVLLFDGVFLLRPELRDHWEYSIFVRADFDVTLERAETRDRELFGSPESVRQRYKQRYVPGQQLYFREAEPERWAAVIVENNNPSRRYLTERTDS